MKKVIVFAHGNLHCARMNHPIPPMSTKDAFRFFKKVEVKKDNQCWPWLCNTNGKYGRFCLKKNPAVSTYKNRKNSIEIKAHKISYFLAFGVDAGQLDVCHSCDNPICVNPFHLFIGTRQDNLLDMCRKGRHVSNPLRGTDNPDSKLTDAQVIEIRKRYASGELAQRPLALAYGVAHSLIGAIVTGKRWTHLPNFERNFTSRQGWRFDRRKPSIVQEIEL